MLWGHGLAVHDVCEMISIGMRLNHELGRLLNSKRWWQNNTGGAAIFEMI
jgi:hypothetical protein